MNDILARLSPATRRLALTGAIVVGFGLIVWVALRQPTDVVNRQTNRATASTTVTPNYFTIVSGTILNLDATARTVAINFPIIGSDGVERLKRYTITVDDATALQSVRSSVTPPEIQTIAFAAFAMGDQINAVSADNVAPLDAFTAKTMLKLLP